jgi:molybdopterin molybdotransferase
MMLPVKEAIDIILAEIKVLGLETIDVLSSPGRVLAEEIRAGWSNPPWDNSAMDGYALRAGDVEGASPENPITLKVIYDLPAGSFPEAPVGEGEAVRIMTGAPVPDKADAVVMVERTERGEGGGDGTVLIKGTVRPGDNIRRCGEDFSEGDIVIRAGALIRPAEVLMLAAVGRPRVEVYRRPVVAVLSTGDELVDIGTEKGKITNSNGYALSALVKSAGCTPLQLGIARDNRESLLEKLNEAKEADCIITSGGVSVGDYDLVKDVLSELGSTMRFWKVALKPGKPLAFGIIGDRPAFGLPGNPVSSMVAFDQFVRPALLKMSGRKEIFLRTFRARLTQEINIKPGRMTFLRSMLKVEADGFSVTPLPRQGSGVISTMVKANSYIVVPVDVSAMKTGDAVRVQPFDPNVLLGEEPGY